MVNLITVVVATYNQEDTIARTLDSILMQECHVPFEILIGEDHSTDGTLAVCEDYQRRYPGIVRVMANPKNKGVTANYFDCLMAARGRYIADCAGDDFWTDPKKLEKQVSILEAHPEVSIVLTNWRFYDEQTHTTRPGHQRPLAPVTPGRSLLKDIITQNGMSVFHLCTSLYRTDIFRQCRQADPYLFSHPGFGCEDLQIAASMAANGSVAYLPDVTLCYSVGHPSASAHSDEARQFRFVSQVTSLSRYLAAKYQTDISGFLRQRLFALAMHAFRAHSPQLRDEVIKTKEEWQVKADAKTRVLLLVMRHQRLWLTALSVRHALVSAKQWLRGR